MAAEGDGALGVAEARAARAGLRLAIEAVDELLPFNLGAHRLDRDVALQQVNEALVNLTHAHGTQARFDDEAPDLRRQRRRFGIHFSRSTERLRCTRGQPFAGSRLRRVGQAIEVLAS
jgi:hypothetical protein